MRLEGLQPDALSLARLAVAKSTVLLTNNGVLPLSKDVKKVALIGPVGDDPVEINGCWPGRSGWGTTLAQGLRTKFGSNVALTVVKGCDISTTPRTKTLQDGSVVIDDSVLAPTGDLKIDDAVNAAKDADVVIMAVGEPKGWTGEGGSRVDLTLGGNQQQLFDAVAATGRPVVTIVFSGRPLALPSVWAKSAAVFYAWQPGIQAGPGLADLLVGDVAPSARLSMSVPREVGQVPIFYNAVRTGLGNAGIYYRDTPEKDAKFWFGYGLTYTTFSYGKVQVTPGEAGQPAQASVTVTNTGARAGEEVVQLYISQMACHDGVRPAQELRGIKRVALKPGEKQDVSFALTGDTLGYIDRNGRAKVDAGDYQIWIAPHARTGTPVVYTFAGNP
jgi:beta-glucosidase